MSPSYAKPATPAETAANSPQIPDEAYRALEDIVGAGNVSRDAAVLDSYAFQWLAELVRPEQSHYMPRPAAVVLPGSTEEVQAVVRLANKYGLKVKPHGTGWYHWSGPIKDEDATLQLDMRRMDSILEIDEQNMYAVVEPYVIAAQLQAELLPLGLNLNIPGVGCSSSIVASACAYHGAGPDTYFMGGNAENVLGMEWVTPEGEIVRTGSLGSGDGWFCSEGPGPSVRAICRGTLGSRGGLGVYTKCAVKLAPHLGQTEWKVEGTLPAYRLPVHERMRVYTLAVPDWDTWAEVYYRIYDNEIGYIFHRQFNLAGADLAAAFWLMYNDHTENARRRARDGCGPRDRGAHRGAAHQLPADPPGAEQGRHRAAGQDPRRDPRRGRRPQVERFCEQDMAEFTNLYLQRLGHKHINFVWAGGYIGSWMQFGTPDWVKGYIPTAAAGLERDAAGGKLVQCGGDAMMGSGSGIPLGGATASSSSSATTRTTTRSTVAGIQHMEDAVKDAASIEYPPGKEFLYLQIGWSDEAIWKALASSKQPQVFRYQRMIKSAFDPNDTGDRMYPTLPLDFEPGG